MPIDTCPSCGVGQLKPAQTVYVQVVDGTLVSAPNVPAWICDVCGLTLFDSATVQNIEFMIGESGPPPNRHLSTPPAERGPGPLDEPDDSRPSAKPDAG
ncbi:MAG TPA: YgiT-type zinc finger protein [Aggregatilinea sp.]|jgi:YgiT-type zinc finger domain-containing protein|uniref:YgiT-type zinc finger protein n=1 Tax=Aggregatilinea sp. TaxID=2806333 RepID=UPI002B65D426|nr:YgiT-type zinc finger protein [Aggregatilinea sp.]HML24499.1 YgiT-type zinc finger protein [Aggregatilinea sp.]